MQAEAIATMLLAIVTKTIEGLRVAAEELRQTPDGGAAARRLVRRVRRESERLAGVADRLDRDADLCGDGLSVEEVIATLSPKAKAVWRLLVALPPGRRLTANQIADALVKDGFLTDEATLRCHVFPRLRSCGLVNGRDGRGYAIVSAKDHTP